MKRIQFAALFVTILSSTLIGYGAGKGDGLWTRIDSSLVHRSMDKRVVRPTRFEAFELNDQVLAGFLSAAPEEFKDQAQLEMTLPMPDGTLQRFRIEHSLVVEPGLLDKFPELEATYRGYGIDDPTATVRFDMMPSGFHAMVLRAGTTAFVDPSGTHGVYLVYEKTALPPPDDPFVCHTPDTDISRMLMTSDTARRSAATEVANGTILRTYRLALAATGEYTAFTGGTVNTALAAQVVSMNRVNGVYERDLSIHMNLVANNNLIIYTNASTDPYTNNNGSTMLGQNQTNLNTVIGSANYDIGHVFSTGGGGVANLQVPCTASKARGVTGSSSPVGDGYDIDYVAHEMGHQFGGNHTFNINCNSQRSPGAAYEVGSGISIMAYAGICGVQDLAMHSIDTFHVKSLEEIVAFSTTGSGNTCAVQTPTNNATPTSITVGGPYTIPISTPFALTATASDPNGDPVTYDWEEYDLGPVASLVPNSDSDGSPRPIFRPYLPLTGGVRHFPSMQYILNNANVPPAAYNCGRATACMTGEVLPTLTRTMNFQVVVRDNRGGINTATAAVNVTSSSGPFIVLSPNTAVTVAGASQLNVTWQVADTHLSPVSAANIDILLSTDGGLTFPTVLASATPNDGNQLVTLPNVGTSAARIKIQGTGKIFFDVSDANFTINAISSNVTVSGRVTASGRGVRNARVTLTDQNGVPRTVTTGPLGMFTFTNVASGQTCSISVQSRRFTFTPMIVPVNDNITNLSFVAN